jgi:2-keto-4-pentenoate hydratase
MPSSTTTTVRRAATGAGSRRPPRTRSRCDSSCRRPRCPFPELLDERLAFAYEQQLIQWRAQLALGAERVGWKLGRGSEARRFGPLLGYLTTATRLEPGSSYRAGAGTELHVDAELAVEIGEDGAPSGYATALELCDLARIHDELDAVVATNLFHRAYVLSASLPHLPDRVEATVRVNGEVRGSAPASHPPEDAVARAAELLEAAGERLEPGDRVITGAVVQVPVRSGDEVEVELGGLGRLGVTIS